MNIEQIMTRKIVTVEMDDKLSVVKEIFDHLKFHHVLVLEYKKLAGIVSDRDLLKAISPNLGTRTETTRDSASLSKRVHQIMTHKPITLHPSATLDDAVNLFATHQVSCIPVVDIDNNPLGIVTWNLSETERNDTFPQGFMHITDNVGLHKKRLAQLATPSISV
jgi:acetoin utilization protein AcuB